MVRKCQNWFYSDSCFPADRGVFKEVFLQLPAPHHTHAHTQKLGYETDKWPGRVPFSIRPSNIYSFLKRLPTNWELRVKRAQQAHKLIVI